MKYLAGFSLLTINPKTFYSFLPQLRAIIAFSFKFFFFIYIHIYFKVLKQWSINGLSFLCFPFQIFSLLLFFWKPPKSPISILFLLHTSIKPNTSFFFFLPLFTLFLSLVFLTFSLRLLFFYASPYKFLILYTTTTTTQLQKEKIEE